MQLGRRITKYISNKKNDSVRNLFLVVVGDLAGNWLSVWGMNSFTLNGIEIALPYQHTAEIRDGKIQKLLVYHYKLAINTANGYELVNKKN